MNEEELLIYLLAEYDVTGKEANRFVADYAERKKAMISKEDEKKVEGKSETTKKEEAETTTEENSAETEKESEKVKTTETEAEKVDGENEELDPNTDNETETESVTPTTDTKSLDTSNDGKITILDQRITEQGKALDGIRAAIDSLLSQLKASNILSNNDDNKQEAKGLQKDVAMQDNITSDTSKTILDEINRNLFM